MKLWLIAGLQYKIACILSHRSVSQTALSIFLTWMMSTFSPIEKLTWPLIGQKVWLESESVMADIIDIMYIITLLNLLHYQNLVWQILSLFLPSSNMEKRVDQESPPVCRVETEAHIDIPRSLLITTVWLVRSGCGTAETCSSCCVCMITAITADQLPNHTQQRVVHLHVLFQL